LLGPEVPDYDPKLHTGATVQLDGDEAREHSDFVALQVLAVPHGEQPPHRETIGDRRIDDGQPDLWAVMNRLGHPPPDQVAAALRPGRRPPPMLQHARPAYDPEVS